MNNNLHIQENISLKDFTTIGLGGLAQYFCEVKSVQNITEALHFANQNQLPVFILGGGSNCIFSDSGFSGLVLHNSMQGMELYKEDEDYIFLKVGAGVLWDDLVKHACQNGYSGIECLSGIPGSTGAVPVQNVGAYGQEVAGVIETVIAYDLENNKQTQFANKECRFSYRNSTFKKDSSNRYIITEVIFRLRKNGKVSSQYPELLESLTSNALESKMGSQALLHARKTVLSLRKKKSMVSDALDPHSRSCGSFFMNAIVTKSNWDLLTKRMSQKNIKEIPHFTMGQNIKIPSAWLIEQSGFQKGFRHKGVGISPHHALALVNYEGTTSQLIELRDMIVAKVWDVFQIKLTPEPIFIP